MLRFFPKLGFNICVVLLLVENKYSEMPKIEQNAELLNKEVLNLNYWYEIVC